jgi:hypothetical protein
VLDSFLIEITANILKFKDETGEPLVEKILDKAGQKGVSHTLSCTPLTTSHTLSCTPLTTSHTLSYSLLTTLTRFHTPFSRLLARRLTCISSPTLLTTPHAFSHVVSHAFPPRYLLQSKGTGKWTAISALDEGIPLTLVGEAVFSRCLSALQAERQVAAAKYAPPPAASSVCCILRFASLGSHGRSQTKGRIVPHSNVHPIDLSDCVDRLLFVAFYHDSLARREHDQRTV